MAVVAISCLSSCSKEKYDTFVEWGFAENTNSEINNGYETMITSAQVILNAFDHAFYTECSDMEMDHKTIMKLQEGKSAAIKNAKRIADKAHSMIEEGHVCALDYIFVVRIKYGTEENYETVWSHDYRTK